jgi:hypothetical protein
MKTCAEKLEEERLKANEYSRQYKRRQRELYPEKTRAAAMRYYHANNGAAKAREQRKKNPEPYRQSVRRSYENNKERYQGYTKAWKKALRDGANSGDIEKTQKYIHLMVRTRARKTGVEYTLLQEDIPVVYKCPVFGYDLMAHEGSPQNNSFSLDKIDPKKGYVKGNVQVVSFRANNLKNSLRPEEAMAFVKWILSLYDNQSEPEVDITQKENRNGRIYCRGGGWVRVLSVY